MVVQTFDDVLQHVGAFGRGQLFLSLTASLSHVVMASVLKLMVFTAQDPITAGAWECSDPAASATGPTATTATTAASAMSISTRGNDSSTQSDAAAAAACAALRAALTGSTSGATAGVRSPTNTTPTTITTTTNTTTNTNVRTTDTTTATTTVAVTPPLPPAMSAAALRTAFCALPPGSARWTRPASSLLSYYGLTCGREWAVSLLDSLYFVGLAVGGTGFGALSDAYGRRACLYGCTALTAAAAVGEALAPAFWLHAVCRLVGAAAVQGMAIADVVLVTELVGPDYRGRVGILTQSFFIAGECLLALLAWLVPDWRSLTLAAAALAAAFLATAPLVPESPRWLAAKGRPTRAAAVLARIARMNGGGGGGGGGAAAVGEEELAAALGEVAAAAAADPAQRLSSAAAKDRAAPGCAEPAGLAPLRCQATPVCLAKRQEGEEEGEGSVFSPRTVHEGAPSTPSGSAGDSDGDSDGGGDGGGDGGVSAHAPRPPPRLAGSLGPAPSPSPAALGGPEPAPNRGCPQPASTALSCADAPASPSPRGPARAASLTDGHPPPPPLPPVGGPAAPSLRDPDDQQQQQQQQHHPPSPLPVAAAPVTAPTLRDAARHPLVRRYFALTSAALCSLVLSYYGIGFALSYIPGSLYVSFFLISVAEAPAAVAAGLAIDVVGRTALVLGGMALSGAACVGCGLAQGSPAAQVLFAMVGKFGCSGAWSVLVVYCAELFPTGLRSLLSGAIYQGARAGGVAAPFVFLLGSATGIPQLPFWLMGGATLAAGAGCVLLPETRGLAQPESLQQLEQGAGRTPLAALLAGCYRRRAAANRAGRGGTGRRREGARVLPGGCGGGASASGDAGAADDGGGGGGGGDGSGGGKGGKWGCGGVQPRGGGGVGCGGAACGRMHGCGCEEEGAPLLCAACSASRHEGSSNSAVSATAEGARSDGSGAGRPEGCGEHTPLLLRREGCNAARLARVGGNVQDC